MWQSGDGWGTLPPRGYAPGDAIYSGDCRGSVVSVDASAGTMAVVWSDGDGGAITYPLEAEYLRKKFPWES